MNIIDFIQTLSLSRSINPFEKQKEDNVPNVTNTENDFFELRITDEGTNLKEYSYSKIWSDDQLGNCTDSCEKNLRNECLTNSEEFNRKEKPYYRCGIQVGSKQEEEIECDLLWKKSHVAYFTAENEDYYQIARKTDWICFCGNDKDLNAQMIIDQLREDI